MAVIFERRGNAAIVFAGRYQEDKIGHLSNAISCGRYYWLLLWIKNGCRISPESFFAFSQMQEEARRRSQRLLWVFDSPTGFSAVENSGLFEGEEVWLNFEPASGKPSVRFISPGLCFVRFHAHHRHERSLRELIIELSFRPLTFLILYFSGTCELDSWSLRQLEHLRLIARAKGAEFRLVVEDKNKWPGGIIPEAEKKNSVVAALLEGLG